MTSSLIQMSSLSTLRYFCTIINLNFGQSAGAGCSRLNHYLDRPLKLSLAILNSLSALRSLTSAAILSLSAQSLTSSWSRPQNNSSMPCGLVILQVRNENRQKFWGPLLTQSLQTKMDVNKLSNSSIAAILLWPHKQNSHWTTHRTLTELPQPQVSKVRNLMGM
jgi:hypothetical protein